MTTTDTVTTTTTIHPAELRRLRQEDPGIRILDVRTGAEFESVHIPGSYHVPLDMLAEHAKEVATLDQSVILVCQSGGRASTAHDQLSAAGKTNLRVLEGGVGAWMVAGGDVVRGNEKWSLERQVRGVAGTMVLASMVAGLRLPKLRLLATGVGFGLAVSALTNTCTMGLVLAKLPYNRGPKCDLECVLREMRA